MVACGRENSGASPEMPVSRVFTSESRRGSLAASDLNHIESYNRQAKGRSFCSPPSAEILLSWLTSDCCPYSACTALPVHRASHNRRLSMTAEIIHRLHFAFTVTFHYLFPQLTMGLALLIVASRRWRCAPAAKSGTARRASGAASSPSISSWAWSPAFPWSSSSAPTGRASRGFRAASSASRWPWRASSASSSSRRFSASSFTAKSASRNACTGSPRSWSGSARGSPASSSSSPTHGCSIPWPTPACPTAISKCSASGNSC